MKTLLVKHILTISITLQVSCAYATNDSLIVNAYCILLDSVIKKSNLELMPESTLLRVIPDSKEQYLQYYSLTLDSLTSEGFYELEIQLFDIALSNWDIAKKILQMSEFVDGEYAEAYFVKIGGIIEKHRPVSCRHLKSNLKSPAFKRLVTEYRNACKCKNKS
ncbi:MAG: hypothetical protein ACKVOR_03330 [Flavobacteriales bacterium]